MRQKVLYLSFLLLMIILLILINRKDKVVQPVLEEKNQQQVANNENVPLLGDNQSPSSSFSKAGVTPIRKTIAKSSSEESLLPSEGKKSQEGAFAGGATSSDRSGVESSKTADGTAKTESPGITKISKRPTAQEKQQLTDKGVLMF